MNKSSVHCLLWALWWARPEREKRELSMHDRARWIGVRQLRWSAFRSCMEKDGAGPLMHAATSYDDVRRVHVAIYICWGDLQQAGHRPSLHLPSFSPPPTSARSSLRSNATLFSPRLVTPKSKFWHYAKRRFPVTSNLRYMHGVLNVDEIKN